QPALGHGRVLLGVQVTGDRFVILPALHISGHVYGLNEPTDALSHQLHGERAGVVVAGRSDGAGGNELPDRASREDAAPRLQPFIAALFQVLVDLEAHLSRLPSKSSTPAAGQSSGLSWVSWHSGHGSVMRTAGAGWVGASTPRRCPPDRRFRESCPRRTPRPIPWLSPHTASAGTPLPCPACGSSTATRHR